MSSDRQFLRYMSIVATIWAVLQLGTDVANHSNSWWYWVGFVGSVLSVPLVVRVVRRDAATERAALVAAQKAEDKENN